MAVEQHQATESRLTQGSSNALQLGQQGFGAEAHSAGKPQMLGRKTKRHSRQAPQRQLSRQPVQDAIQHRLGKQQISAHRQMGPVLFKSTHRQHHRAARLLRGSLQCRPPEVLKPSHGSRGAVLTVWDRVQPGHERLPQRQPQKAFCRWLSAKAPGHLGHQ